MEPGTKRFNPFAKNNTEQRLTKRPVEDDDKDDTDVDADDDKAWDRWYNDETGEEKAPVNPLAPQPEMDIHSNTPEMDDEDRSRQEDYIKRRQEEDNPPEERGVWEIN